jgi:hypothetical protein
MRNYALALSLLVSLPAAAGDFALLERAALAGHVDHFTSAGLGAPSIAPDLTTGEAVVAFESLVGAPSIDCPDGQWAVGVAVSADGRGWSFGEVSVIGPEDGFLCGVRDPAVLVTDSGERTVWGERVVTGADCDTECSDDNGIVEVSVSGTDAVGLPEVVLAEGGSPTVIQIGELGEMMVTLDGDLWGASREGDGDWLLDDTYSLQAGVSDWNGHGLMSPSLSCADGGDYAYELHYTGFGDDGRGNVWGWASGISDEGDFWFIDPGAPYLMRRSGGVPSLDVVCTTDGGCVGLVELPGRGGPVIATLADTMSWSPATLVSRHCTP